MFVYIYFLNTLCWNSVQFVKFEREAATLGNIAMLILNTALILVALTPN